MLAGGIMGKVYSRLDERLRKFIARQPMFFVATAPCLTAAGDGGHVNVSPKGYQDTFAVLGPLTVAYVDLTGSGSETIAHLRQNGRITIMFCSFGKQAKILRIYGHGRVVLPDSPDWPALAARFSLNGTQGANRRDRRAIIVVEADRIADSCGYAVPRMKLTEERGLLEDLAERKSPEELTAYRAEKNAVSIDGLPSLG
jgi:predicted pyridoxine 5'-phosphate oxidase superfamily flavin-nucleotide-binding protein